jgi:hypothetical protein
VPHHYVQIGYGSEGSGYRFLYLKPFLQLGLHHASVPSLDSAVRIQAARSKPPRCNVTESQRCDQQETRTDVDIRKPPERVRGGCGSTVEG